MTEQNKERKGTLTRQEDFSEKLARWMVLFGEAMGETATEQRIAIYYQALKSAMRTEELEMACQAALRLCKRFPTIAELLSFAKPQRDEAANTEAEYAWKVIADETAQWKEVWEGMWDGLKKQQTAEMRYAVRVCGGWRRFCRAFNEAGSDLSFLRKEFLEAYRRAKSDPKLLPIGAEEARKLLKPFLPESPRSGLRRLPATTTGHGQGENAASATPRARTSGVRQAKDGK